VVLSEADAAELAVEDRHVGQLKLELGNARLQRHMAEKKERELCQQILARGQVIKELGERFAEANDLDLSQGNWQLQVGKGRFVRVQQ
jgi:hypothetical protein